MTGIEREWKAERSDQIFPVWCHATKLPNFIRPSAAKPFSPIVSHTANAFDEIQWQDIAWCHQIITTTPPCKIPGIKWVQRCGECDELVRKHSINRDQGSYQRLLAAVDRVVEIIPCSSDQSHSLGLMNAKEGQEILTSYYLQITHSSERTQSYGLCSRMKSD